MSKSVERVRQAALAAGLDIEIRQMADSTHTAEEAAIQCGVTVAQIVKSLVFQGAESSDLYLFLVSGPRKLDLDKASKLTGEPLHRADPKHVRKETGFAIGGVSPLGHLIDISATLPYSLGINNPNKYLATGPYRHQKGSVPAISTN